ncbi:hypothetical protein WDL1P1_00559 (plasmid) [Variovorax sp. WDL1]|nr:hypothetical protein CHC06_06125 [Variovorax sp. B2]PNG51374.1 hypothetical protein CHC07_06031 [Variovorax sp. B4]VTV17649.1 hypothetical protein WDL1P1_00559 [Variovorax sp. WDL1]
MECKSARQSNPDLLFCAGCAPSRAPPDAGGLLLHKARFHAPGRASRRIALVRPDSNTKAESIFQFLGERYPSDFTLETVELY